MDPLLDAAPCGFVSFGDDGLITLANATLHALLGHAPGSLAGRPLEAILTVGARIFHQTHLFPLLKIQGRADEIYLTLRTRSGGEVPVLLNATRREHDGAMAFDCAVFPVHLRGKFEDEILKAKKAAEDAAKARDEFFAAVSHELRTPLNAVLGWVRLMRLAEDDPEAIAQGLEVIERNAKAQARLIEDLVDVSRIVAGKMRIEVVDLEPGTVVEAALDVVRPAAEAKAIRLQAILDRGAGPVSGDPDRLQQVMWNLLSNAVKFTPKGGTVSVRLRRVDSHVEILVSDSGQGIPAEFLPYVFERFKQAEGAGTRRQGGLGLGMAITREIVALHGGTISVRSEGAGKGATFLVNLPVLSVHRHGTSGEAPPPGAGEAPPAAPPRLEGCHVLLVEDAPESRDYLSATLLRCGALVTTAGDADAGFDRLQGLRPHVLVSDIEMPGEDGYALIRRVRALSPSEGGATPAVALTANNRFADRMRALTSGFQFHIAKPVEPDELIVVIANLFDRGR